MSDEKIIVKVQPLSMPIQGKASVRIFDRQRKINHVTSDQDEVGRIKQRLAGRPKAYFLLEPADGGSKLTKELTNQNW